MTPLALPSAMNLATEAAKELLDHHISQGDATWIMKVALLVEAIKRAGGNQCRAARILGMHRNTFRRQIEEVGGLEPFIQGERNIAERQFVLFGKKRRVLQEVTAA